MRTSVFLFIYWRPVHWSKQLLLGYLHDATAILRITKIKDLNVLLWCHPRDGPMLVVYYSNYQFGCDELTLRASSKLHTLNFWRHREHTDNVSSCWISTQGASSARTLSLDLGPSLVTVASCAYPAARPHFLGGMCKSSPQQHSEPNSALEALFSKTRRENLISYFFLRNLRLGKWLFGQ